MGGGGGGELKVASKHQTVTYTVRLVLCSFL